MATDEHGEGKNGRSNGSSGLLLPDDFAFVRSMDFGSLFQRSPGLFITGKMSRPYAEHPWVQAPVSVKGENVASVPLRVYRVPKNDPDAEGEPVEATHPLQQAVDYPNPECGGDDIEEGISICLDLYGEAFLYLVPQGSSDEKYDPAKGPQGWWLVHPSAMKPHLDDARNRLIGWKMRGGRGKEELVPAERIVQIKRYNPYDAYRGLSPMEAARIEAEADHKASRWTDALLSNGGDPGGILTTESMLDEDQVRVLRTRWQDRHSGPANAGKVAILHGGMKWQSVATNARDMEFSNQRIWSREALLAVFGVPKMLVGLVDDVNRNTARETKRLFWEEVLVPRLRRIERALNRQVAQPLNRAAQGVRAAWEYRFRFDLSGVEALRENLEERMARAKELKEIGYSINQINVRLGLGMDEVAWGEEPLEQPNLVPVSLLHEDPGGFIGGKGQDQAQDQGSRSLAIVTSKTRARRRRALAQAYQREFYHPAERKSLAGVRRYFRSVASKQVDAIAQWAKKKGRRAWPETAPLSREELDDLLLAPQFWSGAMVDVMGVPLGEVALSALDQLGDQLGGFSIITPDLDEPWISKQVASRIGAMARLAEADRLILRRALIHAISTGGITNIRGVQQEVSRVFTQMSAGRALTIARTETGMLANRMRREGMRKEGVEKREWTTSNDELVRPTDPKQKANHRVLEGEIVKGDDLYSNGLRWPMDPNGKAEEIINCRCNEIPAD